MKDRRTTPISVRVARWAAIAAAVTAFGSVFNTIWSERPWWETPEPVAMMSPIENPPVVNNKTQPFVKSVQATKSMPKNYEMTMEVPNRKFSWDKWILFTSVFIGASAIVLEIIHRWKYHRRKIE